MPRAAARPWAASCSSVPNTSTAPAARPSPPTNSSGRSAVATLQRRSAKCPSFSSPRRPTLPAGLLALTGAAPGGAGRSRLGARARSPPAGWRGWRAEADAALAGDGLDQLHAAQATAGGAGGAHAHGVVQQPPPGPVLLAELVGWHVQVAHLHDLPTG